MGLLSLGHSAAFSVIPDEPIHQLMVETIQVMGQLIQVPVNELVLDRAIETFYHAAMRRHLG